MSNLIKSLMIASMIGLMSAGAGYADPKVVINPNVLRQMVQLSVAFTQARISFTSPPYPVQFVNTNPFSLTSQVRASGKGPIVSPGASTSNTNLFINNSYIVSKAEELKPGSYTLSATTGSYTLTYPNGKIQTAPIPTNLIGFLPGSSISGSETFQSHSSAGGTVTVTYTFKR